MNEQAARSHNLRPLVAERLRRAALGLVGALLVARPLLVSENAADGSGLWFAQLWLGAAVLWALWQVAHGSLAWRFHWIDLAVCILALAVAASTTGAAAQRPAINMGWEWVALVIIYFLVRQLPQTNSENHGLAVVVLAMAVAFSGNALYEYLWEQPRTKADYLANRDRYLRQLGYEPGSADARRFEDRLLFTDEPLATFASTNSLAGFVLPWLLLGLGWAAASRHQKQESLPFHRAAPASAGGSLSHPTNALGAIALALRLAFSLCLVLIAVCLFLTKSRAAWLGAIVALALWLFLERRILSSRRRIGLLVGLGLAVIAATVLVVFGRGFDQFLVTTALQAVSYRAQYWQGTWGVIREHPWRGVGPGNFQQHYMAHKLPQSSEEIADPHNLFLELWSTSGIFAAAALGVILAGVIWVLWRRARGSKNQTETAPDGSQPTPSLGLDRLFLMGGVGGFLLVVVLGLFMLIPAQANPEVMIILIAIWLPAVLLIGAALGRTPIPSSAVLAAVVALVVNLFATGGIAFPAVAENLWVLIALGLNLSGSTRVHVWRSPLLALPVVALSAALFAVAHVTATGPVTACTAEMSTAAWHLQSRNVRTAVGHLQEAVRRDPLAGAPLQALADVLFQQARELHAPATGEPDRARRRRLADEKFHAAVELAGFAIQRDPRRPSTHWWLAKQFLEHYFATQDLASAQSAAETLERCVELYPTNAAYLAASAEALRLVGRDALAQERLDRALDLLAASRHPDKRIEVLEVLRNSVAHHPQSPVRRAELALAMWHDANWFTLDPRQMQSKLADARHVAEDALRMNESDLRTDTLTPALLENLRQQTDDPQAEGFMGRS